MTGVEDFVRTERRGEGPGALAYLPQGARGVVEVATRQQGSMGAQSQQSPNHMETETNDSWYRTLMESRCGLVGYMLQV
jgi:hypothetical protein